MTDPIQEQESNYFSHLDPRRLKVIRWLITHGAEYDFENSATSDLQSLILREVEFFIGVPTGGESVSIETYKDEMYFIDEGVEIAALVVPDSPLPIESLEELVEPFRSTNDSTIEIAEDHSEGNVWIVRQFSDDQLDAESFNNAMDEYVTLVNEVSARLNQQ